MKRKLAVGGAVAVVAIGSSGAWGWLTTYGEGTTTASVAEAPPRVESGTTVSLLRDAPGTATIVVENFSGGPIEVASIPVGVSRQYTAAEGGDTFTCPAGSVKVGGIDVNGAIVPLDNGGAAMIRSDGGTTTIENGTTGSFAATALFDTTSPEFSDVNQGVQNQDGCLGKDLEVEFGAIELVG